jgi:hypothetical protein
MRNDGTGPSGPIWVKLYTPSQVVLDSPSTDESRYKYEGVVDPASLHPDEQPGGFSQAWYYNFFLPEGKPPTGKYDVLLKVYYGSAKAQVSHARFTLDVP